MIYLFRETNQLCNTTLPLKRQPGVTAVRLYRTTAVHLHRAAPRCQLRGLNSEISFLHPHEDLKMLTVVKVGNKLVNRFWRRCSHTIHTRWNLKEAKPRFCTMLHSTFTNHPFSFHQPPTLTPIPSGAHQLANARVCQQYLSCIFSTYQLFNLYMCPNPPNYYLLLPFSCHQILEKQSYDNFCSSNWISC